MSSIKWIRWTASNLVSGLEPCVWTRQGWANYQGQIYGRGVFPTLFGSPARPLSPRVLKRVRQALEKK